MAMGWETWDTRKARYWHKTLNRGLFFLNDKQQNPEHSQEYGSSYTGFFSAFISNIPDDPNEINKFVRRERQVKESPADQLNKLEEWRRLRILKTTAEYCWSLRWCIKKYSALTNDQIVDYFIKDLIQGAEDRFEEFPYQQLSDLIALYINCVNAWRLISQRMEIIVPHIVGQYLFDRFKPVFNEWQGENFEFTTSLMIDRFNNVFKY